MYVHVPLCPEVVASGEITMRLGGVKYVSFDDLESEAVGVEQTSFRLELVDSAIWIDVSWTESRFFFSAMLFCRTSICDSSMSEFPVMSATISIAVILVDK